MITFKGVISEAIRKRGHFYTCIIHSTFVKDISYSPSQLHVCKIVLKYTSWALQTQKTVLI